jgi:superfamily I DNA and/or RNA helicase
LNRSSPDHSQNRHEVDVVLEVAKRLNSQGKSFRIITPYDPQRSLLENALKQEKLPWEDKCFNIDAFQGNGFIWLHAGTADTVNQETKMTI